MLVVRPIVRSFAAAYLKEAAAHVRGGGHAVVWDSPRRARLVIPKPERGDLMDLGMWAIYDLDLLRCSTIGRGALAGFAFVHVPSDCLDIVKHRAERDSVFPGPTRALRLDCLACGACCRDNRVELEKEDIRRFERAGRADLLRRPWARRDDGTVVLVLRRDKRCKHLSKGNLCAIYPIRPNACSSFPPGSEGCLFSREEIGLSKA
jgi:uncharacterized protein